MGGSEYSKVVHSVVAGRPPSLDLDGEKALIELLVALARAGVLASAHDPSLGGLSIALAESSLRANLGFTVELPPDHRLLFSESPSRALVSCDPQHRDTVMARAQQAGVTAAVLGTVGGQSLDFGAFEVDLGSAKKLFEEAIPRALDDPTMVP
jgi:phosphoribosylformylglycinamidine synthase